jgi:hypothetical protein
VRRGSCHHLGCVDAVISSLPSPQPCRSRRARFLSLSSLALPLPVSTPRVVAHGGGGDGGGVGRPRRHGSQMVGGAGSCPSLLACPFPPLASLLPISTPRAVARSGGWRLVLSFHRRSAPRTGSPFPPREQLLPAVVGGPVVVSSRPAVRRPVVHPVSRGSQQ